MADDGNSTRTHTVTRALTILAVLSVAALAYVAAEIERDLRKAFR